MSNIFLTITIDVEPDCSSTWHYSSPLKFNGVKIGIKNLLQPLFNKYNIIPTYLINNVVLEDSESVEVFQNLKGRFELGTHLHPEFIEPQKSVFNYAGSKGEANSCYYPPKIEYQKIKNITNLFKNNFGYSPISFRSGRFSAGKNTIKSLVDLGYKVDTSVTPLIEWSDKTREFPVSYIDTPIQPYWTGENSFPQTINENIILEVPVTIIKYSAFSIIEILKSFFGLRRKISFSKPKWLRPIYSNLTDFKNIVTNLEKQFENQQIIVLNMMFHNVEVIPGISPYTRNQKECDKYLQMLEDFFIYCNEKEIQSVALSSLYEKYKSRK